MKRIGKETKKKNDRSAKLWWIHLQSEYEHDMYKDMNEKEREVVFVCLFVVAFR
jgi:hypothetical protein